MGSEKGGSQKKDPAMHLVAGGIAGMVESSCCHPLDTIKTRVQLSSAGADTAAAAAFSGSAAAEHRGNVKNGGAIMTAKRIILTEGFPALYKGLSAVMAGIVPKMAVRFSSFEVYKDYLGATGDATNKGLIFLAGLGSGVTEAIAVVTPAEVCKIRMQAQFSSSLTGGLDVAAATSGSGGSAGGASAAKYRNVLQTAALVTREEGIGALYKGLAPTVLRQGCNQAVNFTCYQTFKAQLSTYLGTDELASWQHMLLGGLSGGIGPCVNNPLDVVKTRLQKQVIQPGQTPKYGSFGSAISLIAREEGLAALWKGLTPRLMRIMPGQAITFMTYEWVSKNLSDTFFGEQQTSSTAVVTQ